MSEKPVCWLTEWDEQVISELIKVAYSGRLSMWLLFVLKDGHNNINKTNKWTNL